MIAVNEKALLIARGWREVEPARWTNADLDRIGALPVAEVVAIAHRRETDAEQAREHGSVTYRPTAEQAQTSPLCCALAAQGATERDVIEHLFQAYGALEERVKKEAELRVEPMRVLAPSACPRCGYAEVGDPDPHGLDRS